jgi:hypothetical protein
VPEQIGGASAGRFPAPKQPASIVVEITSANVRIVHPPSCFLSPERPFVICAAQGIAPHLSVTRKQRDPDHPSQRKSANAADQCGLDRAGE